MTARGPELCVEPATSAGGMVYRHGGHGIIMTHHNEAQIVRRALAAIEGGATA